MFTPDVHLPTKSFKAQFFFTTFVGILLLGMSGCGGAYQDAASTTQYPRVVITTAALPSSTVGTPYVFKMTASGGNSTDFLWAVQSGKIPDGIKFDLDGTFSGTPTTAGKSSFTITVQHTCYCVPQNQSQSDAKAFDLTIN